MKGRAHIRTFSTAWRGALSSARSCSASLSLFGSVFYVFNKAFRKLNVCTVQCVCVCVYRNDKMMATDFYGCNRQPIYTRSQTLTCTYMQRQKLSHKLTRYRFNNYKETKRLECSWCCGTGFLGDRHGIMRK